MSAGSVLTRDVVVGGIVGVVVIAAMLIFHVGRASDHSVASPPTGSQSIALPPSSSPSSASSAKPLASRSARAAAATVTSHPVSPNPPVSTGPQQVAVDVQPTEGTKRTTSPAQTSAKASATPQAAQITRQAPAGYAAGDETALQPILYAEYCVAWQDNVDATEYWLGTDTTPDSQGCTSPMLPDGNWQYSVTTGLLATDDSNDWCLSIGSQTSEGVGLTVVPCDKTKTAQRWSFVDEGGQYLVKSDEGLCLYGVEENSAISSSAQICGSTNSNELFHVNSY